MYRILMIDDDPDMIDLGKLILEREGNFEVLTAHCGKDGLEILNREDGIDLILLDIMMVGMNGWEVLETLRNRSRYANIPVIMLTAHHYFAKDKETRPKISKNVSDFVLKPFIVTDFVNKIRDAIRYKRILA